MTRPRTIKGFILTAALVVSVVLFAGMYLATTHVFDHAVRRNAATVSRTLAQATFQAMFQIMRRGWTRPEVEAFIHGVSRSRRDAPYDIHIYRGELVTKRFGPIDQGAMDQTVKLTFRIGQPQTVHTDNGLRYTYPLMARDECLRCHTNASIGKVLGVIDVKQDLSPLIAEARHNLIVSLLWVAPLPFLVAILVAMVLHRKVNRSVGFLESNIERVNRISDLTNLELQRMDLGFAELNNIFAKIEKLTQKLKSVAVDKELLEFEIRLLEKFVITSEVVRDWREYISFLLIDINKVIQAYTLFSIFKVDDELFDLEVFWIAPPTDATRAMMEKAVHRSLQQNPNFHDVTTVSINHNVSQPDGTPIGLDGKEIELQTKSLIVDTPKIGGIVGIGVHADIVKDETRLLVMESILSTLLNVVGSVKAIYKYTRDLEFYATRDPLTNLYNQRLFWEMLGYEISRAERHGYKFTLLVIDLDNFKTINDSFGHSFGDDFLREFAHAVQRALRTGDIFARYGGDEVVVVLPETDTTQAATVGERILENAARMELTAPDGTVVQATVSVGVAIYPDHATDMKDLFLFADNMMYKAKTEGKNRIGVPTEEDVVEIFRSIGEKSIIISKAIKEKRIIPYFQPILHVEGNRVEAVEVLSRIELEDKRIMGASEFIEIAEKMGMIHLLDYAVMEKAFQRVRDTGYAGLLFVNLSPRALVLNEFSREVRRLTSKYGINPRKVVFEITERDTVKNFSILEKFVHDLKMEDFKLAIDDFGSGFSSFHYLKRFPIDYLKIEGDFIVNMINDKRDKAFVYSMAALARELGIKAVAEFVENEEVLAFVRAAGIEYAQGYHIGRPATELAATEVMAEEEQTGSVKREA